MMMHHGHCHGSHMMSHCQMPQLQPVVCPAQRRYHDQFFPVEQPIIHPIVNVNRVNPVVVPRNYYTETTESVMGSPVFPGRGFGGGRRFNRFGRPF
ncbi:MULTISPECIES: hypothetical protein [Sporosarcina]|uniref:Spore coat protein D n=1 Tax=Sporosarcina contaminans TaxID=633403 RepID=A0ABW3U1Z0_9BACL